MRACGSSGVHGDAPSCETWCCGRGDLRATQRGHSIPDGHGVAGQRVQRCSYRPGQPTSTLSEQPSPATVVSVTKRVCHPDHLPHSGHDERTSQQSRSIGRLLLDADEVLALRATIPDTLMCGMSGPSEEANVTKGRQLVVGRQPNGHRIELIERGSRRGRPRPVRQPGLGQLLQGAAAAGVPRARRTSGCTPTSPTARTGPSCSAA